MKTKLQDNMTKERAVSKHSSKILGDLLAKITPVSQFQTNTRMTVAARIDDLIIARGWGKSELAQKLNKNPSEVTKWLSGTQNFTLDTLSEIAFIMQIPVSELFAPMQIQIVGRMHVTIKVEMDRPAIQYLTRSIGGELCDIEGYENAINKNLMITSYCYNREHSRF
nr:helix-turn-helix transcriptional regulator [uncultured Sediminibacterium sp.]